MFTSTDPAATPLTTEETLDLIPTHITNKAALNAAEQANILQAERWAVKANGGVLTEMFSRKLHLKMFGQVWRWAGSYRTKALNIGIDAHQITPGTVQLMDDVQFWLNQQTYSLDEIAVRFHHRLTQIHAFPNGNGRHARLMADLLLIKHHQPRFTWGRISLVNPSETRKHYIKSLQQADREYDYDLLLKFARS